MNDTFLRVKSVLIRRVSFGDKGLSSLHASEVSNLNFWNHSQRKCLEFVHDNQGIRILTYKTVLKGYRLMLKRKWK